MLLTVAIFLTALAVAVGGGRNGLRGLVALAVILAPLRGGLLTIANDLSLSDPSLTVNATVPALVAAIAIGCFVQKRPQLAELPRPLLIGWGLIALTALLSFPFAVVGLKLFGIGLAQYLVYPTLALVVWPLFEPGDGRLLTRLTIVMGVVVAVTVVMQASGVEGFIQAASAHVEGLGANRYAGITGSYLHTSAFLGCISVLVMGELPALRSLAARVAATALLGLILSGVVLTFSRSGVVIAIIGVLALFAFAVPGGRIRFAALVVPAAAIALAAGTIGGVSPAATTERVTSAVSPTKDAGNKLRTESFNYGFEVYGDASPAQQLLGRGVASTGNAQQLVQDSAPKVTVESYYLKLLVETGALGMLLIGGFLVWAGILFALSAWRPRNPWAASVGAAGLGLSLYNVIYPALETQVLALTWWLLLVVCLRSRFEVTAEEPADQHEEAERAPSEPVPAAIR